MKAKKVQCKPKIDMEEVSDLWSMVKRGSFWEDEHDQLKTFKSKEIRKLTSEAVKLHRRLEKLERLAEKLCKKHDYGNSFWDEQ